MGTKNNPAAAYDCYANAEPDEPMFILLARDKAAAATVRAWVARRQSLGLADDPAQIQEALECAAKMEEWRAINRPTSTEKGR